MKEVASKFRRDGHLDEATSPESSGPHRTTERGDTTLSVSTSDSLSDAPDFTDRTTSSPRPASPTQRGDEPHSHAKQHAGSNASPDAHLFPETQAGLGGSKKPPATTSEGKAHQNFADPSIEGEMELEIDGHKSIIV